MVASVLRAAGMSVTVVDTGPAALDSARSDPPDLILADFDLEGMNVAAFASRARSDVRSPRPVPILVMMSPSDSCDTDRLSAMGIQASIRKPIDSDLLRQAVNQWIPAPSAETVVLSGRSPWVFPSPADNGAALSSPQQTDHNESSVIRLNDTGETAPSLASPPPPMAHDIPSTMSIEPAALSGVPEVVPIDPTPPIADLSPAVETDQYVTPDPVLHASVPEAKAEATEYSQDIMAPEKEAPAIAQMIDLSPVFCSMTAPVVADPVDTTPGTDLNCEIDPPSPMETPPASCEMPPPPAPEISAADLRTAVEAEIAARLPEIVRALLTPEMAQAALAQVAREIVPPMAQAEVSVQLPEIVRTIVTPEMAQTALAKVAREVAPPIAEAAIIKAIQRVES